MKQHLRQSTPFELACRKHKIRGKHAKFTSAFIKIHHLQLGMGFITQDGTRYRCEISGELKNTSKDRRTARMERAARAKRPQQFPVKSAA